MEKAIRRHRFILHSDLNNFYASVECMLNPKIKDTAVIIVGDEELRHGVVLAKNNIAKQLGVKTGDTVHEAQVKCFGTKLTKLKARLDLYQKVSKQVQQIYLKHSDMVEMFGIDEAWIDITPTAKDFIDALNIAEHIRMEVKHELGLTVSIGVSYNKIFAKLGSDLKKPDAITLITRGNFKDRIWPLEANTLLLVGKSTTKKLEKMNIKTIGDLALADVKMLEKIFGIIGRKLWNFANGLDSDPVKRYYDRNEVKSIGNSITYPHDLTNIREVSVELYNLAEQVSSRLRKQKLFCNEIQLFVRNNQLQTMDRQCKLPYPTDTSKDIAENALELFKKTCSLTPPIRSLGIRLKDFSQNLQTSILDESNISKQEKIDTTIEIIRKKYGENSITRGHNLIDDYI